MALALPKLLGSAFHGQRVRSTDTMAAKISLGEMGFRPPPGRRRYFRLCSGREVHGGKRGLTRGHSASETSQD
jgi:hypothetical protein